MSILCSRNEACEQLYSDVFGIYSNLSISVNFHDWRTELHQALLEIGFDKYLISVGGVRKNDTLDEVVTNFPNAWLERYRKQNYIHIDPIVNYCREHIAPIFWQDMERPDEGELCEFWRDRERYGLVNGVSVPIRNSINMGSINVSFGADVERVQGYRDAISQLFVLIPFALEGLTRLRLSIAGNLLSGRELECLQWASFGKTSWEICRIIGCTERTVNYHMGNVLRKLGASNRRQAVQIALSKGIITI